MFEIKLARPFGNNGREAEHWSENLLHPYKGNVSAIADCLKLRENGRTERKGLIIIGYEHSPSVIPLDPAVAAFELIATKLFNIQLKKGSEQIRSGLRHPVHQVLRLFAYQIIT